MSAPIPAQNLYLGQARATKSVEDCMSIYDKWAATYNDDVMGPSTLYVGPKLVAEAVLAGVVVAEVAVPARCRNPFPAGCLPCASTAHIAAPARLGAGAGLCQLERVLPCMRHAKAAACESP